MGKEIETAQISIFEYAHMEDPVKTYEQETFEEVFGVNFKVKEPNYTQMSLEEYMGGNIPMIKVSDTPSPNLVICDNTVKPVSNTRVRTPLNKIGYRSRRK